MLPELTRDDLVPSLEQAAGEALEQARVTAAPINALDVAQRLGFSAVEDALQQGRAKFARLGGFSPGLGRGSIFVRPDPRPERVQ